MSDFSQYQCEANSVEIGGKPKGHFGKSPSVF